jgi:hypothetical protein
VSNPADAAMPPVTRLLAVATACLTTIAGSAPLAAQRLEVSLVAMDVGEVRLAAPLVGAGIAGRLPLGDGGYTMRFGLEHVRGAATRTGVPCAGLIEPGTCAPERVRDDARLTVVTAGIARDLLTTHRSRLAVLADIALAGARADARGATSGRVLSADELLIGAAVGVEASWEPVADAPWRLEFGATIGGLRAGSPADVVDGDRPFADWFGARRLRLGASWRFARLP